jgi:hypothetical protein
LIHAFKRSYNFSTASSVISCSVQHETDVPQRSTQIAPAFPNRKAQLLVINDLIVQSTAYKPSARYDTVLLLLASCAISMALPSFDTHLHCHCQTRRRAAPPRVAANNKQHAAGTFTTCSFHLTHPHHHYYSRRTANFMMSMSLVDIDANSRQPGFKPSKQGSMIPGAPKFQQSGSTGRRSPFSVSMTGSPSYTAMPTATKTVMSPTPASKLPRKSTPTQSAFSKSYTYGSRSTMLRTSLPRAREGLKPSATAVPANSVCIHLQRRITATNLTELCQDLSSTELQQAAT